MREELFVEGGGVFVAPSSSLLEQLKNVKGLIFDWDGVFNNGVKGGNMPSPFSEVDSMGVNMLRFGYFLEHGKIPFTAVVTGEYNEAAFKWAQREHLDAVCYLVKDKVKVLPLVDELSGVQPEEIMFTFDDILDISLAKAVGARFMIGRDGSPLFTEYCRMNGHCDYITGNPGNNNAVREISEVALCLLDRFDETIDKRVEFEGDYATYINLRQQIETKYFKNDKGEFIPSNPFE
ncbi:phosphatase [Flammeovirga yaeyamensis]|uniref:Phosphatase n=1 Tax=Flammeovirga yaeyamensis TaxID=367791 RepID=A0AAX1N5Y7_9BACT|nr:phosphatase [Flammeovirga yaeyamensis]MBB3698352.1 3-deoxy-D-manno-octulosonate 8-phosphate phosphatase (KDO 8-P phosphatase) [Flammeovirga yaeyamensis]NMF34295.1 phosphatase [Flammeovirga yaeyamensis]QWG01278.1 phosphatase [Flammeovirga yaeyamensis]